MIDIYGIDGIYLGSYRTFGEAKLVQEASLPDDLKEHYAGVGAEGTPLFYTDNLTDELLTKYSQLA